MSDHDIPFDYEMRKSYAARIRADILNSGALLKRCRQARVSSGFFALDPVNSRDRITDNRVNFLIKYYGQIKI